MSAPWEAVRDQPPVDATNVMGRRFGAYLMDNLPLLILAAIAFFAVAWSERIEVKGVRSDFCEFINDGRFFVAPDPLVEQYRDGYVCVQLGNDAALIADEDFGQGVGVASSVWILGLINVFVIQGFVGATLGKLIFGLRVVRTDGTLAGFGRNAGRSAMLVVDGFCCGLVGLITVLATKPHRRVGDMVAGTYVVATGSVGRPVVTEARLTAQPPSMTPPPVWQPGPMTQPPTGAPMTQPPTWGTAPAGAPTADPSAPSAQSEVVPAPSPTPDPVPTPPVSMPPVSMPPVQSLQATAMPPGAEMRWDDRWNAWLYWDPTSQRWLRHDPTTNRWIAL